MMAAVRSLALNSGYKMPILGIGTWQSSRNELGDALRTALDVGYRHIDTAYLYQNEDIIGDVIHQQMCSGKLKRDELFITTKLPMNAHHPDRLMNVLQKSLQKLRLDYVDLYLIHCPMGTKYMQAAGETDKIASDENYFSVDSTGQVNYDSSLNLLQTWKGMEACVEKGLTRSIGVSNFNSKQLKRIYDDASIKPAVLQVECNAYFNQMKLRKLCKSLKVTMTAYSPLGSPRYNEIEWPMTDYKPKPQRSLFDDAFLKQFAQKHKKTVAQVALRYLVQLDICAIPKSVNPNRIRENFEIFDFELSADEMKAIDNFVQNERTYTFDWYKGLKEHVEYPFHEEF